MNTQTLLLMWSDHAGVSALVWWIILTLFLYTARKPMHELLRSTTGILRNSFRLMATNVKNMADKLNERNNEVLIHHGKQSLERVIEREFQRVNAAISKDLSSYPSLHRKISDAVQRIEEDYRKAADTPPSPPSWLSAVETVAAIPRDHDSGVARILDDIEKTIGKANQEIVDEYRKTSAKRHGLLKGMTPVWRTVSQGLEQTQNSISDLEKRASFIDKHMENYEQIRLHENNAVRALYSSSLTQFFISGLVLFIAVLGGIINFQLISMPMSEMVGGTSYIGDMRTADVAALVIIMVEIAMGLFLLESLRITKLFPVFGTMDDKMRHRMLIITLTILTILASVEASLAYMRDLLAMDREALSQSLAGVAAVEAEFRWIPSIGQMILGFILPFTLAFVAIPLESFIHSLRAVIGVCAVAALRGLAFTARFISSVFFHLGRIAVSLYDATIFLPLRIETSIQNRQQREPREVTEGKLLKQIK